MGWVGLIGEEKGTPGPDTCLPACLPVCIPRHSRYTNINNQSPPYQPHRTGRASKCFRVNYRSMERSLTNEEVDVLQEEVRSQIADQLKVELR